MEDPEIIEQPAQGIGLPEIGDPEEIAADRMEAREAMALPSDMRDPGDPEGWDVGVAGGIVAGEIEMDGREEMKEML